MSRKNVSGWAIVGIITFFVVAIIIEPALLFWLGYFSGWLAKLVIGTKLVTAINMVFGTAFTADMLPMIGGALGWIGGFFKSVRTASKNKIIIKNNN